MSERTSAKRLLVGYLCVAVAVAVLASLYGSYSVQDFYVQQTSEDLEARARLCARQSVELLEKNETAAVDALCKELGQAVGTRITVIRPTGEVVGDTDEDPKGMEPHGNRPEIKQAMESPSAVGRSTRYSTTTNQTRMYVAVAWPEGPSPLAVVRTSLPITTVNDRLRAVTRGFLGAGLVVALLIIAAIPWFSIRFEPVAKDRKRRRRQPDEDEDDVLETPTQSKAALHHDS